MNKWCSVTRRYENNYKTTEEHKLRVTGGEHAKNYEKSLEKGKTALDKALQYSYLSPDLAFTKFHDSSDIIMVVIF